MVGAVSGRNPICSPEAFQRTGARDPGVRALGTQYKFGFWTLFSPPVPFAGLVMVMVMVMHSALIRSYQSLSVSCMSAPRRLCCLLIIMTGSIWCERAMFTFIHGPCPIPPIYLPHGYSFGSVPPA